MTTEAATDIIVVEPTELPGAARGRILVYLSVLIVLIGFGAPFGGLIATPIGFFLKNKLHLTASQSAVFGTVAAIPLYFSFVFGFIRDTWNPFGLRDRGYMILFGGMCAVIYAIFAFVTPTYGTLLVAGLLLTSAFLFVQSAQTGLTAVIGQQHVMSGQVATAWNVFLSIPALITYVLGGLLSDQLEGKNSNTAIRILFLVGSGFMLAIALYGFLKPKSVYGNLRAEHGPKAHPWTDFKRLMRHWPIYPALLIWTMWNFAPGSATPLQYYLQNQLHAKDAVYGEFNGIFSFSFIPTFMIFGWLCQRIPLRRLLFWGTVIAVPQMVPLLFIHTPMGALIAAAPIGLMGGIATAAYVDLGIRSCPPGLQGVVTMASTALYYIASQFGNLLGTYLYDHFGGFPVCVIAITTVYALILPALWLVPRRLTATTDGETPEGGFAAD